MSDTVCLGGDRDFWLFTYIMHVPIVLGIQCSGVIHSVNNWQKCTKKVKSTLHALPKYTILENVFDKKIVNLILLNIEFCKPIKCPCLYITAYEICSDHQKCLQGNLYVIVVQSPGKGESQLNFSGHIYYLLNDHILWKVRHKVTLHALILLATPFKLC